MALATAARSKPQVRPHDVLVIGAGGAGLRAAIEAKAAGADVGLVCKSLLGKAHTVMAEGGVAAALRPRRRRRLVADPLPRHDGRRQAPEQPADGRAPRDWRRPTASASSSCGAPSSTGPRDGRILQRPFGGHSHPRLAHVGDRTGLEMIRTLQDRAVALGHRRSTWSARSRRLITGPDGRHRRVRLLADDRASRSSSRPRRSSSRPAASARPTRSPRTRGSTAATARRWPTRPAPS